MKQAPRCQARGCGSPASGHHLTTCERHVRGRMERDRDGLIKGRSTHLQKQAVREMGKPDASTSKILRDAENECMAAGSSEKRNEILADISRKLGKDVRWNPATASCRIEGSWRR